MINLKSTSKKLILSFLSVAIIAITGCNSEENSSSNSTASSSASFHNLSFQANYNDRHPSTIRVFMPFLEKTAKHFNNEITFDYFSNGQLYDERESYAVISDGRVDFGVIRPAIFPSIMDVMSVVEIPGFAPNAIVGALIAQDVMAKFPEAVAELPKNSAYFTSWGSDALQVNTNTPIKSLAEIRGKKLIVWDAIGMEIAQALGANPVRMSPPDTYLALSKNQADGVLAPNAPLRAFKISEVSKYHFLGDFCVNVFQMAIFKDLWDEFTPEMQEYFVESAPQFGVDTSIALEQGSVEDIQWLKGTGHEFTIISDADRAEVQKLFAPFKVAYIEKLEKKGIKNAKEILAYAEERAKVHIADFESGKYGDYSIE